jgi:hypothetical protein
MKKYIVAPIAARSTKSIAPPGSENAGRSLIAASLAISL